MFVSIAFQQLLNSENAYTASVIINFIELFLLACLILEFLMASYSQGFCNYFRVKLQALDCIIIFLTLALVLLDLLLGKTPQFTKIAAVIKGMFRFFRIILLFRKSNQFKKIKAASSIKTPAEKIIDVFTDLKEFFDSKEIIEDIEWSISVIALNKIYETKIVIQGQENNKEIVDWINYGARQKEEQQVIIEQENILSNKILDTKLQSYVNQIPSAIIKQFKDANELSFDCFELEKIAKGSETSYLLLYLFQVNNILASVDIEPEILYNFFKEIEKGYKDNLYHNRLHAFDVLQTANFFLKSCKFIELAAINEFDLCVIFISAACHDYDHPGVNNAFIINTSHEIALTYNDFNNNNNNNNNEQKDQSVLENHHASKTFQLLNDPNLDITTNFTKEQFRAFREMVISIILSTDMAKHFSDIAKLKSRLGTDDYDIKGKDKQMCIDTIIHACDVSNPVKTWNVYSQWAHRVLSEFWSQGDQERNQGLQITYLCDRYTTNTAKSQVGFIDFIVKPLYEVICNFLPELKNYMQQIDSNKQKWNELIPFYDQDLVIDTLLSSPSQMDNILSGTNERFDQHPPRHSSLSNLKKSDTMKNSNSYLNQFYYKQMEIIKLQKALQGYQVRGKINPINQQRASTGQLNDSSANASVRLPQINQDNLSRINDSRKKVLQPVKISAQIKYNLSKEIQDLQSNNLNGNYYYLQDKNEQWESRKQSWLQGLDGCLQSGFLDYQEMYEKFFKGKYEQKKSLFKSKRFKVKNHQNKTQNNEGSNQKQTEENQNKLLSTDEHLNTSFQQGDEEQEKQDKFENSFKKDEPESQRNTSNIQEQTEHLNKQAQSSSQNTSLLATNRISNQDQENQDYIDNENNDGVDQNQQIGQKQSARQQEGLITEVILNQGSATTKNVQKPQIKPIQIQKALHENNISKKKEPSHQEHQLKLSIVSPSMQQNTYQSENKYFVSSHSLNSNNQAHQSSRMLAQNNKYQPDNQLQPPFSPLHSNISSQQEFFPINNQAYANYSYQISMYLNTLQNQDKSSVQLPQTKFSLAQLKTKNFSKVQQSSQKSEDFFFRVSQVVNVKKVS